MKTGDKVRKIKDTNIEAHDQHRIIIGTETIIKGMPGDVNYDECDFSNAENGMLIEVPDYVEHEWDDDDFVEAGFWVYQADFELVIEEPADA